ncbi:hypothetical protein D3C73_1252830 [compost metagenome]
MGHAGFGSKQNNISIIRGLTSGGAFYYVERVIRVDEQRLREIIREELAAHEERLKGEIKEVQIKEPGYLGESHLRKCALGIARPL